MFVVCQVVCLASGCAGKDDVADIELGVRALGCAVVGVRGNRCGRSSGVNVLWSIVVGVLRAFAGVVGLLGWCIMIRVI